jgi:hypothetical protein
MEIITRLIGGIFAQTAFIQVRSFDTYPMLFRHLVINALQHTFRNGLGAIIFRMDVCMVAWAILFNAPLCGANEENLMGGRRLKSPVAAMAIPSSVSITIKPITVRPSACHSQYKQSIYTCSLSCWLAEYCLVLLRLVLMQYVYSVVQTFAGDSSEAKGLQTLLTQHPECEDVALPIWAAFQGATPPVYVDVPLLVETTALKKSAKNSKTSSGFSLSREISKSMQLDKHKAPVVLPRDECLTKIYRMLNSPELRYSTHKASNARKLLFW